MSEKDQNELGVRFGPMDCFAPDAQLAQPKSGALHYEELATEQTRAANHWFNEAIQERSRAESLERRLAWRPIETAPKADDNFELSQTIILGFAAEEEDYAPRSREGFWSHGLQRFSSSLDPMWDGSPQPTHWMPLPDPPERDK